MSKLDALRKATGANVAESMGRGVPRMDVPHGASTPAMPDASGPDRWTGVERLSGAQRIAIERITRDPEQPRETFDEVELAELAESIRARGILQPIRVRWDEDQGMYVVIAGERRLRASRAAGLTDVPCVIHDSPLSEAEILLDQLAENLIRLDLEPIEQAKAFRRLMDSQGWSARRLAEELRIDHDKVNRAVRLLVLPTTVQEAVADGQIAPTTAFELSKLDDDADREAIARRVVAEGLSRDEVARTVRQASGNKPRGSSKGRGGKAKARKLTRRIFRTPSGRVTIENGRGLDAASILAALETVAGQVRSEVDDGGGDAAA